MAFACLDRNGNGFKQHLQQHSHHTDAPAFAQVRRISTACGMWQRRNCIRTSPFASQPSLQELRSRSVLAFSLAASSRFLTKDQISLGCVPMCS